MEYPQETVYSKSNDYVTDDVGLSHDPEGQCRDANMFKAQ